MGNLISKLPGVVEYFPPTPTAHRIISIFMRCVPLVSVIQWSPLAWLQAMGKTSTTSSVNLPGRYAWSVAEAVGPLNLIFILFTLPAKLRPPPNASGSLLGTGLPLQNELLAVLYVVHYINRAGIVPLYRAPSMSPIHPIVAVLMAIFQYANSSNIACWLTYSTLSQDTNAALSPLSIVLAIAGVLVFILGLVRNIQSENHLFELRRAAARRKAKSEGRAVITYDKVYVIPPAEGLFKTILFPHYSWEWLEWTGFYIVGGAVGLGWAWGTSAASSFLLAELATMAPRAVTGVKWYQDKFGKRAVGGRKAVLTGIL